MNSSLVEFVNNWFTEPDCYPISFNNRRTWIYIAIVDLLGTGLHNASDYKKIHNFFMYSLLGCNPVTACIDTHIEESNGSRLWDPEFLALIKRLLNFEKPVTTADRYRILQSFERFAAQLNSVDDTQKREEELVLTILMFWFLDRRRKGACLTLDIVAVRACLDLYHRSKDYELMPTKMEATKNHPVNYASWLSKQLNRLLVRNIGFEELCQELSYLAWFASLIRANRLCTALGLGTSAEPHCMASSLRSLLKHQVEEMYKYLDQFPLIAIDETDGATDRILNVFGVKTRRKG